MLHNKDNSELKKKSDNIKNSMYSLKIFDIFLFHKENVSC